MLRALVLQVVAPKMRELVSESQALHEAVRTALSGTPESRIAARGAFKKALGAWEKASAIRCGPLVKSNLFVRAMFWPARPKAIEAVLAGTERIDQRFLEEQGADAKGMFGLEYLLFTPMESDGARPGAAAERRGIYGAEICANIVSSADRTARLLGDGQAHARAFVEAGPDGVRQLVSQSVDTVEALSGRLTKLVRRAGEGELRPTDIEGYASETSLDIAMTRVAATESMYVGDGGGGLGDIVAAVSKPIDDRVRTCFAAARAQLGAVGAPLERAVKSNPAAVASAVRAVKALEIAIKVDLASALGLTLTFASGDGD